MPEIDPITRDALRRASQMQSHTRPPRRETEKKEPKAKQPKPPEPAAPKNFDNSFKSLFKDNDRTLIILLIILLMDSEDNTSLLLALVYLLT